MDDLTKKHVLGKTVAGIFSFIVNILGKYGVIVCCSNIILWF